MRWANRETHENLVLEFPLQFNAWEQSHAVFTAMLMRKVKEAAEPSLTGPVGTHTEIA